VDVAEIKVILQQEEIRIGRVAFLLHGQIGVRQKIYSLAAGDLDTARGICVRATE